MLIQFDYFTESRFILATMISDFIWLRPYLFTECSYIFVRLFEENQFFSSISISLSLHSCVLTQCVQ